MPFLFLALQQQQTTTESPSYISILPFILLIYDLLCNFTVLEILSVCRKCKLLFYWINKWMNLKKMENLLPSNHCAKQGLVSCNNIIPLKICWISIVLWIHNKRIINKLQKQNSIQLTFQQFLFKFVQVHLWWCI